MNYRKIFYSLFLSILFHTCLFAQSDSISYTPKITGTLRPKFEQNLNNGMGRFNVRNARYKVSGNTTKQIGYTAELDLSDEGELKMLDAHVKIEANKNFTFFLGQAKIPFSTDNLRSPHELLFANRSFIAKRICKNLRDIGAMLEYKNTSLAFPFLIKTGIFNGEGINNPEWEERYNYAARIELQPLKNLDMSGNYYTGLMNNNNFQMFGFGFSYNIDNWHFESEYSEKYTYTDSTSIRSGAMFATILYHIYPNNKILKYITPAARYDMYDGNYKTDKYEPGRLTTGVTFGFAKMNKTHFRIDYENYFYHDLPDTEDKITFEIMVRF